MALEVPMGLASSGGSLCDMGGASLGWDLPQEFRKRPQTRTVSVAISLPSGLQKVLQEVPLPEPALLAAGGLGGPALIGALTPMRNATTLAAQDKATNFTGIYRRVFQQGFRNAWAGMLSPMVPATMQFTLIGPGYHVFFGLLGSPAAACACTAFVESLITYGPSMRNAMVAHNQSTTDATKRVALRSVAAPMGPAFEWLLLRNCVATAGIRVLSAPMTEALTRAGEAYTGKSQQPATFKPVGDFLASLCTGAISMPFNQLFMNQVTSSPALAAGPLERCRLGLIFLKSQYFVKTEQGRTRLSGIVLRDAAIRSTYAGLLYASFAAVERAALAFAHKKD